MLYWPEFTANFRAAMQRSHITTYIGLRARPLVRPIWRSWPLALELAGLAIWAAWVGRTYLDFDPSTWPAGIEFPMATQGHIVWTWLSRCGDCALWNGSVNGGSPALVDLHGAVSHPLVILTTALWGMVVGAKVTLVICLFLAGLTQWWLARILGLGRFARLWGAALAVVAGHLAGRMEVGVFGVVLSTAFGGLTIVAAIGLAEDGRRRSAVLLAALLALTIMAGQGYIQLGMVVAVLPACGLLLVDERLRPRPVWRQFAIAGGLALLLSAFFLVPLLHFWPGFAKDTDPNFASAQPVGYGPLNLVIDDVDFFRSEILQKQVFGYLYITYVGWVPVLLAMAALRLVPRARTRLLLFFVVAIGAIYLTSGAVPFKLLQPLAPEFMAGVRNPSLIAGLAVPLVLGLAAWGLDLVLRNDRCKLALTLGAAQSASLSLAWLIALPALWAIQPAYSFSQQWLGITSLDPANHRAAQYLITPNAEWVQFPYGEGFWLPGLLESGAKIASVFRPWGWAGRENPPPSRELTRDQARAAQATAEGELGGLWAISHPDVAYAAVSHAGGQTPCTAQARGGHIDVRCTTAEPGVLVVRENAWRGWRVTIDGAPAQLGPGQWLEVATTPGSHSYSFRYRPWDALIGALLSLSGIGLATWYLSDGRRALRAISPPPAQPAEAATPEP